MLFKNSLLYFPIEMVKGVCNGEKPLLSQKAGDSFHLCSRKHKGIL